ncbi:MAG: translation initiation factor IF-2 N-terminal domain-containing protein, partial [Syntrophales bacterium]|nr:translation initiation factor IF-2 N-terminal domain-containing protein [Syntrophales bacterium]
MSKIRVYELAKELGIENKDLITRLEKLGIAVKAYSSSLEDADVQRVRKEFALGEKDAIVEERVKRTVIRRRAVRQEVSDVEEIPSEPQPEIEGALKEAAGGAAAREAAPAEGTGKEREDEKKGKRGMPEKKPRRTSAIIVRAAVKKETKVMPPAEKIMPPAEKIMPPAEKIMPPAEKIMPPAEKIVPPAEKVMSPRRESSRPPQEAKPEAKRDEKALPKPSHKIKKPVEVHVGEDVRKKKTFL